MTELHIKNMVCNRCVFVVQQEFIKHGLEPLEVGLGFVKLEKKLNPKKKAEISEMLIGHGFELLDSNNSRLIEMIKNIIIAEIHHTENIELKINWSELLADKLNHDYNSLSSLFSSVEGVTIEQFIIRQKIEKVKEFLFYGELTLSEISYKLGYSSVQHLSTQFKKTTGQTPTQFKSSIFIDNQRKALDSI